MSDAPRRAKHRDEVTATGTPRWVKVFAAIALAVVVLIAVVLIAGRDSHGPGRHADASDAGNAWPPAGVPYTAT
jgi:hypothetical protein